MGSYKLSLDAEADLIRIYQWGAETYGAEQAETYYFKLIGQFERIAETPLLYPQTELREGYRRSVFGRDSIFYSLGDGFIIIHAIIGQQDADNWL